MPSTLHFSREKKFGLVTLFFLVLWELAIAPTLNKLPSDFSFSTEVTSVDNFYNEDLGDFSGEQYSKTQYYYETVSSDSNTSIIKNVFDVKTLDDEPIFSVERLYGIDRSTGAHVPDLGDKEREGHLFAPKNLNKGESFTYWHINYDGPAEMKYVDSEFLYGLRVYHYESDYEGISIDQTANLTHLPDVGITKGIVLDPHLELWIEPTTGHLVKYADDTTAYYYDLKTGDRLNPWNHFHNTVNEEAVEKIASDVKVELTKQNFINLYLPFLFIIISLYLLLSSGTWGRKIKNLFSKERLIILSSLIAITVSSVVLTGWITHREEFIRIFPSSAVMHPLTAINFILLSLGLTGSLRFKKAHLIGAVIISSYCLIILGSIFHLSINDWFFKDEIIEFNAHISLITGILFTLLGANLIVYRSNWGQRFSFIQINSAASLLLGLTVFFGYLVQPLDILSLPFFFSTSMHTSLLFILMGSTMFFLLNDGIKTNLSLKNNVLILGVLFITLLGTISFTTLVERSSSSDAQSKFLEIVEATTSSVANQLEIDTNVLAGGRGLFSASQSVDRNEWHAYVDSLDLSKNYPGIQGMGYAVMIDPTDLVNHIQSIQSEGFSNYTVYPEGEREIYSAIIYIEPFDERNQKAFGFDMFQEANRRLAMELARDTGTPKMSARITLVQETDPNNVQSGFLIYVPVYKNDTSLETVEERQNALLGYVYSPFRAENFITSIIGENGLEDIRLKIIDGTNAEDLDAVLYDDESKKWNGLNEPRFSTSRIIYSNGRPWVLTFQSTEDYGETFFTHLLPILTFLLGLCISFLISGIVYVILNSRQSAVAYADQVTKKLKETLNESIRQKTELETFNKLMVGRELKMIELKEKLKQYEPKSPKNDKKK